MTHVYDLFRNIVMFKRRYQAKRLGRIHRDVVWNRYCCVDMNLSEVEIGRHH